MNDFFYILTTDDFFDSFLMFYGVFIFSWLIKLGINAILSIFNKI